MFYIIYNRLRVHSSFGRTPALQAGGSQFDPDWIQSKIVQVMVMLQILVKIALSICTLILVVRYALYSKRSILSYYLSRSSPMVRHFHFGESKKNFLVITA